MSVHRQQQLQHSSEGRCEGQGKHLDWSMSRSSPGGGDPSWRTEPHMALQSTMVYVEQVLLGIYEEEKPKLKSYKSMHTLTGLTG